MWVSHYSIVSEKSFLIGRERESEKESGREREREKETAGFYFHGLTENPK